MIKVGSKQIDTKAKGDCGKAGYDKKIPIPIPNNFFFCPKNDQFFL
jgi:hypothetical protein